MFFWVSALNLVDKEPPPTVFFFSFFFFLQPCSCPWSSLASIQIRFSVFSNSDALIPRALTSKRSGELGCTQSQYWCRGLVRPAAVSRPLLCSPCLQWLALCSLRACSPATADWTLDPETDGFSSPTVFFSTLPTIAVQGQGRGWNCLFVCAVSLRGGFIEGSPLRQRFISIQPCPLSPTVESRVKVSWLFRSLKNKVPGSCVLIVCLSLLPPPRPQH